MGNQNSIRRRFFNNRARNDPYRYRCTARLCGEGEPLPWLCVLGERGAWEDILFRCTTHPTKVSSRHVDESGDTALHWILLGKPPVEVVEALLAVDPTLAAARNRRGQLPLHVACACRSSTGVVRALLQAHPQACRCRDATTAEQCPLHILCRNATRSPESPTTSIRAILETSEGAASAALTAKDKRRPLDLLVHLVEMDLVRKHIELNKARAREEVRRQETLHDNGDVDQDHFRQEQRRRFFWKPGMPQVWEILCWLMQVEHEQFRPLRPVMNNDQEQEQEQEPSTMLQSCVGSPHCPDLIFALAIELEPHSMDPTTGQWPIHVLSANHSPLLSSWWGVRLPSAPHSSSTPRIVVMWRSILMQHPQGVYQRDAKRGMLPIQWAAAPREEEENFSGNLTQRLTMEILLSAYPSSLESLKLDSRFYPRILHRLQQRRHGSSCASPSPLSTIFEIIKARPHLVPNE